MKYNAHKMATMCSSSRNSTSSMVATQIETVQTFSPLLSLLLLLLLLMHGEHHDQLDRKIQPACLSLYLSVTSPCSTKMVNIGSRKQHHILDFRCQRSWRNSKGGQPKRSAKYRLGRSESETFEHLAVAPERCKCCRLSWTDDRRQFITQSGHLLCSPHDGLNTQRCDVPPQ